MMTAPQTAKIDRRRFVTLCTGLGVAGTTLPATLWATIEKNGALTKDDIAAAEKTAGIEFTDDERELMLNGIEELRESYAALRKTPIANSVPPALHFQPVLPGFSEPEVAESRRTGDPGSANRPTSDNELAFLPVTSLARLLRRREVSSVELTKLYLERLKRHDPLLQCVVTLTEERALEQARQADKRFSIGDDLGPLHGIPWGAKDLLAVPGHLTTWGAATHKDQVVDETATVVRRLDRAGAVLVAKLTLGALAWGDVWFGGTTKNPWNTEQGSSGSSAGPGSATSAGLVGFSIGSETWGSIVSPSTRCGVTGLRPTFGRVSRHGAMALSWSMDKLGPMCRSVEDCALVLEAIHGSDGLDLSAVDRPFVWNAKADLEKLRFGYLKGDFESDPEFEDDVDESTKHRARQWREFDFETLEVIRSLGVELVPIELPDLPIDSLSFILTAEAAAAFDDLTRSGRDDALVRQVEHAWPNVFRQGRTIPAVEYIQANRLRTMLMLKMERTLDGLSGWIAPSFRGSNLLMTNLTGHPAVVLPNGFADDGTPTSVTINGRLFGEAEILALAYAYQEKTGFHREHPVVEI